MEEAGLVVSVVADVFQDQAADLAPGAVQDEKQVVALVEPRTVEGVVELAHVGAGEVAVRQGFGDLVEVGNAVRAQLVIDQDSHGACVFREGVVPCRAGGMIRWHHAHASGKHATAANDVVS